MSKNKSIIVNCYYFKVKHLIFQSSKFLVDTSENKYVVIKQYKPSPKDSLFFKDKYTELDYYLIRNFVDAWFVDNVGSYLIVIEREKQ